MKTMKRTKSMWRGARPVRPGRAVAIVAASAAMSMFGIAVLAGGAAAAPIRAAGAGDPPTPIDFVVLVDESGSISSAAMVDERAAASLLTQGEISAQSRAAVIGFGSANAPNQSPVDPVCPLTTLDAAGRQQLSACAGNLHKRTVAQGQDTDFPNAIDQALQTLAQADDSAPKLIFMLTDGQLDVHNSPGYGPDQSTRNANGAIAMTRELAEARQQDVQIWPLGFGSDIDRSELAAIAAGGYQSGCANLPSAVPGVRVVSDSGDVTSALLQAFAGARCLNSAQSPSVRLTKPTDLYVTIPPVATDGSIEVIKADPKVVVTYFDPAGHQMPDQGAANGSQFEASGQNSTVEALRIDDPLPGTWRVHLEDPAGYGGQTVSAAVIWKGVLRSFITVSPPAPRAGQRVLVRVRLQTRAGVVLDQPADLAGIEVSAGLTGSGFPPLSTALAPDGARPGGEYSGYLTVPAKASGALVFTGSVLAQGVTGDDQPTYTQVQLTAPPVTGAATVDGHQTRPGGSFPGTVQVGNTDSRAHVLKLQPTGLAAGEQLTVSPDTVTVPAGSQASYPFTVTVGQGTPAGVLAGQLAVTDTTTGQLVDQPFFNVDVVPPPSFWSQWWWAVLIGAALAAALVIVVAMNLVRNHKGSSMAGQRLVLYREGTECSQVVARAREREIAVAITGAAGQNPKLRKQRTGQRWVARRTSDGSVELRSPRGEVSRLGRGQRKDVGNDLELGVETGTGRPGPSGRDKRPPRTGSGGGSGTKAGRDSGRNSGRNTGRESGSRVSAPAGTPATPNDYDSDC